MAEVGGITAEQVTAVSEARSIHYDWSGAGTVVNAYSPKVDIAKLFLRFQMNPVQNIFTVMRKAGEVR